MTTQRNDHVDHVKGAPNYAAHVPAQPRRAPGPHVRLLPSHFHAAEPGMVMFMPTCAQTVVLPTGISTLPFMYHLRSKGAPRGCAEVRRGCGAAPRGRERWRAWSGGTSHPLLPLLKVRGGPSSSLPHRSILRVGPSLRNLAEVIFIDS